MTAQSERPWALLVDDNPMVRRAMALLLSSVGWDVTEANHAEQALEQIKWRDYDLAIIDLQMPDIDGIELCRRIQLENKRKKPALFLHSGYITDKRKAEAISTGAHGILDKPIGRSDLIAVLKQFGLPCTT